MKTKLLTIILSLFLFGCQKSTVTTPNQTGGVVLTNHLENAKIGDFAIDNFGYKYKKIKNQENDNTGFKAELWERVEPVDPKHQYTPALSNEIDPTSKATFTPLAR